MEIPVSKARTQTNPALRKLSDVEGRLQRLEQVIELERARNTQMASRLRHLMVLQQPVNTPDGGGGVTRSWSDVAGVWAEIAPLSGNERLEHMRLESHVTHRIRLRWRDDITPIMRVVFGTRIFAIRAVTEQDGKRRSLELIVEEGAGS